jgi:quercetin dioxygenase-like cupin family protein
MKYDIIPPRQRTDESPEPRSVDTAVFVIKGQLRFYISVDSKQEYDLGPGDFVFIPAGESYYAENLSSTVSCEAVTATPAASFKEG